MSHFDPILIRRLHCTVLFTSLLLMAGGLVDDDRRTVRELRVVSESKMLGGGPE